MRYVSTRGGAPGAGLATALLDGLAPDGGLYVPDAVPVLDDGRQALAAAPLAELGARVLAPFAGDDVAPEALRSIVGTALDFPIPLVEIEPGLHVLELFHGPTLAFKDVAARVMARLFGALRRADRPLTVLVATSGDTGGAVAHAFAGVAGTRVIVLYPRGRVSPTQEAQLTMFNGEPANVRAYAVEGTFDDCQRLVKQAFADPVLRRDAALTSANSINIGRLLPQMIYYWHALRQLQARLPSRAAPALAGVTPDLGHSGGVAPDFRPAIVAVPSGNFGNLTAGVMAKRAGLPIARFIAATNANDIVPAYLRSGRFEPRPSIATIANAMDVGNPSNFERLRWIYGDDLAAMQADIDGSVHTDEAVRDAIRRVYEARGYLLDPHSAIGYLALKGQAGLAGQARQAGSAGQAAAIFLATAHPAKFREIVEPIVGTNVELPAALAEAMAKHAPILDMEATGAALRQRIVG